MPNPPNWICSCLSAGTTCVFEVLREQLLAREISEGRERKFTPADTLLLFHYFEKAQTLYETQTQDHNRQRRLNNNSNSNNVDLSLLAFDKTYFTLVIASICSTANIHYALGLLFQHLNDLLLVNSPFQQTIFVLLDS